MNYRHIYHAGNICDVVKHAALTLLLEHLREKEKPFCVVDTHAGIGLYDLQSEEAGKTAEAQAGIYHFLSALPLPQLQNYYAVLEKINPGWKPGDDASGFRYYPGSPMIITQMLRPDDRLVACELHEEDFRTLRYRFYNVPQAQIHHRDGYEALRAFLPPTEKRGLVLIDPPFEDPDEFDKLAASLIEACKRWPQGQFVVWYPIKERPAIWRFHEVLAAAGLPKMLYAEFVYEEELRHDRLNGCGLLLINAPWQMDEKLSALFPALHEAMNTSHRGSYVKELTGS